MVSLPSFLKMAPISDQEALHLLKTMKGHLSSFITMAFQVMKQVGEKPCPSDSRHGEGFEQWGEVLYKLSVITAFTSQDLEDLTNQIRKENGKKPLDYSESHSNQVIAEWFKLLNEKAEEMGCRVTGDGRLVRS